MLTTYPAPNSNSIFVNEAHVNEFPEIQKIQPSQLKAVKLKGYQLDKGLLIIVVTWWC